MYTSIVKVTTGNCKCPQPTRSIVATAIAAVALTVPQTVGAETFHCSSGDVACLTAAIQLANVNGQDNTIRLEAGMYTLAAVENVTNGPNGLPSIIGSITIRGAGADRTNIARASDAPEFRLFHVMSDGNLTLDRVNLTGGRSFSGSGGAIYNNGGVVNIVRTTIVQNFASGGGGLSNSDGTVNVSRSTFARNGGGVEDGGLRTNGGNVRITQSRFSENTAFHGAGGMGVRGGTVFVTTSTFQGNGADDTGAIRVHSGGTLVVSESSFTQNSAGGSAGTGGAIGNFGGAVFISNSTFSNNVGSRIGHGTAIGNFSGTLTLLNSTLTANTTVVPLPVSSALSGGATTLVQNTIVAGNTGGQSPQDCDGPIKSLGNNLIGTTTGCGIILEPSDLTGDPGLGAFTDNDKPGNGHFPLLHASQAIDAGNDAACPETDQIGRRRTGQCDIGAITFRKRDDQQDEDDDMDGPEF